MYKILIKQTTNKTIYSFYGNGDVDYETTVLSELTATYENLLESGYGTNELLPVQILDAEVTVVLTEV